MDFLSETPPSSPTLCPSISPSHTLFQQLCTHHKPLTHKHIQYKYGILTAHSVAFQSFTIVSIIKPRHHHSHNETEETVILLAKKWGVASLQSLSWVTEALVWITSRHSACWCWWNEMLWLTCAPAADLTWHCHRRLWPARMLLTCVISLAARPFNSFTQACQYVKDIILRWHENKSLHESKSVSQTWRSEVRSPLSAQVRQTNPRAEGKG